MATQYQRSKKRFPTARSAWLDVAKKEGIRPRAVMAAHTRGEWVFKLKPSLVRVNGVIKVRERGLRRRRRGLG